MAHLSIEQAIFIRADGSNPSCQARSAGFLEDWLPLAENICRAFGDRPAGIAVPACQFALPFGAKRVAVVQAADQPTGDNRPATLGFHFLILPSKLYRDLGGDPFLIAARFPPSWQAQGQLGALTWAKEPLPPRTVEQVQRVLKRANGPSLLGGAQVLVDGGKMFFERPIPDPDVVRDLWLLLPTSTRWRLWPATFAFSNRLGFDVLVLPKAGEDEFARLISEEQAADYPQGTYEFNLQIAAENGNQSELEAALARRSRSQTLRLGLIIMIGMIVLALLSGLFQLPPPPAQKANQPTESKEKAP